MSAAEDSAASSEAAQTQARWKVLNIQYQVQETVFWCGPAATRIALSARVNPPSQGALARELGTTSNGTDYIGQVTSVLNAHLGGGYETREMPNDPAEPWQKDRLWNDIVLGIDNNFPVVANIVAPPGNQPPGYPSNQTIYHYFAVIGYNPDTWEVFIADSAYFSGNAFYWLPFDKLATLIPPKGYSAWSPRGTTCPGGSGKTLGEIDAKYVSLGGCGSFLGVPITNEMKTPDGGGRFSVFQNGSIYWTERLGAHEVHGAIRDAWAATGWEPGPLRYPTTDELGTPDGVGRYNEFEEGAIYFTPKTGPHEVYGVIYKKWQELGREQSALGYPTSGEYDVSFGRKTDFEHGSITWNTATNEVTVYVPKEATTE